MSLSHANGDNMSFVQAAKRSDVAGINLAQESEMSTCTHDTMTNHHDRVSVAGLLAGAGSVLQLWHDRHVQRRELAEWGERDIRDAGLSLGEVMYEAGKPFWRA